MGSGSSKPKQTTNQPATNSTQKQAPQGSTQPRSQPAGTKPAQTATNTKQSAPQQQSAANTSNTQQRGHQKDGSSGSNDSEFPTPRLLAEAQGKQGRDKGKGGKSKGNMPAPCPPPTSRSSFFDPSKYKNVDNHALQTSQDLARAPLKTLVDHLCKNQKDDVARVRAFFVWIGAQELINFDWNPPVPEDSALYQLVLVYSGNGTLNDLLAQMCSIAKIPCQMITGAVKPPSHKIGATPVTGYRWCAVYVSSSWRLIDQDAATGYIIRSTEFGAMDTTNNNTPPEHLQDQDLTLKKKKDNDGGSTARTPRSTSRVSNPNTPRSNIQTPREKPESDRRNDYYFFPDPEQFIYDHCAEDPEWQLLARQVTMQEFEEMATLDEDFFGAGFYDTSEPRGVIKSQNGQVNLKFFTKPNNKHRLCYNLVRVKGKKGSKPDDLNSLVYMENDNDGKMIKVFLKEVGIYRLQIYAVDPLEQEHDPTFFIAKYLIECDMPAFGCDPYPNNPRGEFGPGYDMNTLGIEPTSHPTGTIQANLGIATIKFTCNNQPMEFTHFLESREVKKSKLSALSRHYHIDKEVIFVAKLPKAGRYSIRIYAKAKDTDDPFFNICTYLIQADIGCLDDTPFPPASSGRIGYVAKDPKVSLQPVSHTDPIVRDIDTGDLHLTLTSSCDLELNPTMDLQGEDYREDLSEYVWYWTVPEERKVELDLRFPRAGTYSLNLYARDVKPPEGGSDADSVPYRDMYKYVLIVNQPHTLCFANPGRHVAWAPHYQIKSPKDGYLLPKTQVHYEVMIPGAEEVGILNHSWTTTPLNKRSGQGNSQSTSSQDNTGQPETQGNTPQQTNTTQPKPAARPPPPTTTKPTTTTVIAQTNKTTTSQQSVNRASASNRGHGEQWWDGDVDSGPGGRNITLVARFPDQTSYTYLLEFQVLSTKEMAKIRQEQDEADKDARARLKQMDRHRQNQQTDVDYRHKEQTALARKHEEEHERRREQIKQEMEMYREQRKEAWEVKADAERSRLEQSQRPPSSKEEEKKLVQDGIKKLRLSSSKGNTYYRKKYLGMKSKMVREQMREATRLRDRHLLQSSIMAFEQQRLREEDKDLTNAKRTLDAVVAKEMLKDAEADMDADGLQEALEYIRAHNLYGYLQRDVQVAERLLHQLRKTDQTQSSVLNLNRATISEIRSYRDPPDVVRSVMTASMLVLGEDEQTTKDWTFVQKTCATLGHEGLNMRILEMDAEDLHPEIVARAKQIVGPLKHGQVQCVSAGAASFHVWLMGTIDAWEKMHEDDDAARNAEPADIPRQREIFGRVDND